MRSILMEASRWVLGLGTYPGHPFFHSLPVSLGTLQGLPLVGDLTRAASALVLPALSASSSISSCLSPPPSLSHLSSSPSSVLL